MFVTSIGQRIMVPFIWLMFVTSIGQRTMPQFIWLVSVASIGGSTMLPFMFMTSICQRLHSFGFCFWPLWVIVELFSSAPASLTVCKFSLQQPHKISCLVVRIKHLIVLSNLSKMKNNILTTCLQGNCRESLGEFSNSSHGVFDCS